MLRFPTPAPHAKLYFWNSGTTICKIRGSASAGMSGYFYLLFAIRPGGVNMVKNIQLALIKSNLLLVNHYFYAF